MQDLDLILISVGTPVLCGLYQFDDGNLNLFDTITSTEKTLQALPFIFERILPGERQDCQYRHLKLKRIFYANGPGSFTSLKLTHIFLHTLKILYNVELYATSSFYFTTYPYLKAFGNQYFMQTDDNISLVSVDSIPSEALQVEFILPQTFDPKDFTQLTQPLYILPPI